MKALVDTNILIDYLNGISKAEEELKKYESLSISLITWMEVLVGAKNEKEEEILKNFLIRFTVVPITQEVAERGVALRRAGKLRLPDAIIWATAQMEGLLFVTRNIRDFPQNSPGVRIPYQV